jgi:hypothetical protein
MQTIVLRNLSLSRFISVEEFNVRYLSRGVIFWSTHFFYGIGAFSFRCVLVDEAVPVVILVARIPKNSFVERALF